MGRGTSIMHSKACAGRATANAVLAMSLAFEPAVQLSNEMPVLSAACYQDEEKASGVDCLRCTVHWFHI
jgi:hypothetical protein